MLIQNVSIWMAVAAGLVSFLSPCVLPLVPGYISFLSGVSVQQMQAAAEGQIVPAKVKRRLLISAALFVAGFSAVFIALGATATLLGGLVSAKLSLLTKLAGVVIFIFGIIKLGLVRWLFLFKDMRFNLNHNRWGLPGAALLGAAFAFGWTPCVGPILGAILMYAGTLDSACQGVWLLLAYALGLGVPFLLMAAGVGQFMRLFQRFKRYVGLVEKISGAVMIVLGIMVFTDTMTLIPGYLTFLNRFTL
jgi:cytochrome c-type biogenesis protein